MWDLPLSMCGESYSIQVVQERLNAFGAGLEEDGQFGPATERAVQSFQRRVGLPTTGVVNYDTWYELFWNWYLPGTDFDGDGVITPPELLNYGD